MAKRAKAFSKIFKAGEVKKCLLSDDFDNIAETPEQSHTGGSLDDDYDFPIEPTSSKRAASAGDLGFPELDGDDNNMADPFGSSSAPAKRSLSEGQFPDSATGGFDSSFEGKGFAVDDTGAFNSHEFKAPDETAAAAFPDAGAFEGVDEAGILVDFPKNNNGSTAGTGEEGEDELEVDEAVMEAAFQASFSGLGAAIKTTESPGALNGKKVKKRLTKMFKRKDDKSDQPVSRVGEIVVDKSKIPTTKVEMDIVNGKLVALKQPDPIPEDEEQQQQKEKSSKNRFKSLKKSLKKKAEVIGVEMGIAIVPKEKIVEDDSDKGLPEGSETTKDNSEEAEFDTKDDGDELGGRPPAHPRHSRRRRSLTGGGGGDAALPSETQRRSRRRESRLEHPKGGGGSSGAANRLSGGSGGAPKSRSEDTRMRRSRSSDDGEGGGIKMRRSRTSENGGSSGRRRQSLLEKHAGAQNSPRKGGGSSSSNKPRSSASSGDGGIDESTRRGGRRDKGGSDGIDASTRRGGARGDKGDSMDTSARRGGRDNNNNKSGDAMDGSIKRSSAGREEMDASTRRGGRRDGARREPRKSIRKTLSSDGSEPALSKKKPDSLSSTSHGPMRRTHTVDSSLAFRRAQSTRRLGKNDLIGGESGHKGGLTDRERLRRATMTGENNNNNKPMNSKKAALGSLYGGGGARVNEEKGGGEHENDAGDQPKRRPRVGSDGDILEDTIAEVDEVEASESNTTPLDTSAGRDVIVEEPDEDDTEGIDDEAAASGNLSSKDIEKLVRAVVRKAEDARDTEEVEAIVMDTLHKSSAVGFETSFAHMIDEELDMSVDSEVSLEEDKTKGGLNRKDVQDRTRNYVNVFLKSGGGLAGGDARVGKQVASELGRRPGAAKGGDDNAESSEIDDSAPSVDIDDDDDIDENSSIAESVDCSVDEASDFDDDESNNKQSARKLSREDMSKKIRMVKAAKALAEKDGAAKSDTRKKPDFSAVASRLEAKAEAKTRARMRSKGMK